MPTPKRRSTTGPLMLPLLLMASATASADEAYWGYSYRNIDVTASGSSAYAVNLARYCVRLDAMLTRILGIKTSYRPPTHIYALPAAQLTQFLGGDSGVSYRSSAYDSTILMGSTAAVDSDYWSAYFGYSAALLATDGRLRGPDWYMLGVPMVFASTTYRGTRATLGNVTRGYALTLGQGGSLIPMRTFLSLKRDVAPGHNLKMYDAEAWALAHEVYVEGWHRAEFGKYLDLMRQGTSEAAAFAASFSMSYDQLDKEFAYAIHQRPYVYTMDAPDDPPASRQSVQQLSAAEVKGRLALLSVRYKKGPDAVELANEALQLEPANQSALRALAIAQFERGAYGESLAAVDRLTTPGGADAAYADGAFVLAGLSRASASGKVTLPMDTATLRRRAKEDYERALAANADDRRSRDGLAELERSP